MAEIRPKSIEHAKKPRVIVIDGEIGAGKTTILSALSEALRRKGCRVGVAPEPVGKWREVGILGRFYQDPARYAYEFQTYTFVTRIMATRKCVEETPNADVYLLERSILTDRHVFMELQREIVGEQTMQMYDEWCGLHSLLMPVDLSTATFLYLKPDLAECMTRVGERAREEETKAVSVTRIEFVEGDPVTSLADGVVPVVRNRDAVIKKVTPAGDSSVNGKGGVSLEYQRKLRSAHEVLFEGKLQGEISPPAVRPFPLASVVIADGKLANLNFTETGSDRDSVVNEVLARLGL